MVSKPSSPPLLPKREKGGGRGRPRSGNSVVVRVVLSLHPGEDDDLIELFGRTPARRRAAVTLRAMRAGGVKALDVAAEDEAELQEAVGDFLM